jgi:hypothetical protein
MTAAAAALYSQLDSLSPVSEGFMGDAWLCITSNLCHISHHVRHWFVLDLPHNVCAQERGPSSTFMAGQCDNEARQLPFIGFEKISMVLPFQCI